MKLMPFGKYKGTPLGKVDLGYLDWLSNNLSSCPNFVKKEISKRAKLRKQHARSRKPKRGREPTPLPSTPGFIGRAIGKGVVHIWDGEDTACRMYSTGGMRQHGLAYSEDTDKEVCQNCLRNLEQESMREEEEANLSHLNAIAAHE